MAGGRREDSVSTRGFIGFVANGRETIAYNHSDSYPSYLGAKALDFARYLDLSGVDYWREKAANIKHVSDAVEPTQADIKALLPYTNVGVSGKSLDDWYCLLRETQGSPRMILECGYAEHDGDWPLDSLFCEWGYLFDLDAETFEVYKGFQTSYPTEGRWAGQNERAPRWDGDALEYKAVQRVAVWPLSDLPSTEEVLALEQSDDE
jgi:hypothetical protein